MNDERDWRERYREAAMRLGEEEARLERTQTIVRLLVGRLCLAAKGRAAELDAELSRVSGTLRGPFDLEAIEQLLAPLSQAIAVLDREPPRRSDPPADSPVHGDSTAPFRPAPPQDDLVAAGPVLDNLALLPEMRPAVEEFRARGTETLSARELAQLLNRLARIAGEQHLQVQREKLELEHLALQMTSRLDEISSHLTTEAAERDAGHNDTEALRKLVTGEVEQLKSSAERAPDLTELRRQLTQRLDAINLHLQEFREREEARIRSYRERVQSMRTRIAVLERESRSLHRSLKEEQRNSLIDALTGIPNRAAYDERIEEEFRRWRRSGGAVSVLAWDIDRFKAINDAYGHKAGDKVLRVVGQHLARHVRETDFVARYGGEEFVMLLVGTAAADAFTLADKIRLEISRLGFHFHEQPVAVTASCGITAFAADDTPDRAFDRADRALYRAKQAGRNCCMLA